MMFEFKQIISGACFRYHHNRCKGTRGCDCWCHKDGEINHAKS
jgi:hypothetical protein